MFPSYRIHLPPHLHLFSLQPPSICLLHPGCLSPGNGANLFSTAKSVSPLTQTRLAQQLWWQITPTCLSALCTCCNRVCLCELSVRVCSENRLCFSVERLCNRNRPPQPFTSLNGAFEFAAFRQIFSHNPSPHLHFTSFNYTSSAGNLPTLPACTYNCN